MPSPERTLAVKREQLIGALAGYGSCAVAFSGGVDSAVVAQAAQLALGQQAVAVTGVSESLASGELDDARQLAAQIGIRHEVIDTREFAKPGYRRNAPDRCFHCKTELYLQMDELIQRLGVAVVANGANLDDRGDHRPGMQAARDHQVRSPLLECQLNKADVRALAAEWKLPVWDKPASPCLASRIAYGVEVTPERTRMVDLAERFLRERGFRELRVRYHHGDLARVEIPREQFAEVMRSSLADELTVYLTSLGFKYVTLDLQGFRSGSMNEVLPVEALRMPPK